MPAFVVSLIITAGLATVDTDKFTFVTLKYYQTGYTVSRKNPLLIITCTTTCIKALNFSH